MTLFDGPGAFLCQSREQGQGRIPDAPVNARQVQQMYIAYYGRPGDPPGVDYCAGRLAEVGGNWISDLVNAFGTSEEYTERFADLTDETLIDNLFVQRFNRVADPVGRSFYIDLLNGTNQSGYNASLRRSTLAVIALGIANGAQNDGLAILENKLRTSECFTEAVHATGTRYSSEDIPVAGSILCFVFETMDSLTQALAPINGFLKSAFFYRPVF